MADERYSRGVDGKGYLRKGGFVVQDDAGDNVVYIGLMMDGTSRGIQILDELGNSLIRLGDLPDGTNGLQITSALYGWDLVKMTDQGWSAPHIAGVASDPTASKMVTSGTFTDTWQVTFGSILGPGVEVQIPWVTGSGTTGELQVTTNQPGISSVVILPAASSGYHYLRWLHGATVGGGPLILTVQARRTGGSNSVTLFQANGWVQDPAACSAAGLWV